jgi:hypothetical protein
VDAHAQQYASSHLYSVADSHPASDDYFNTHPYATSHMDSFPHPDPRHADRYPDSLADAYPASNRHLFLDSDTHRDLNALETLLILHML